MDEDFANDTSFVFTTTHPENEEQTLVYTLSPEMVDFATIELDTVNGKVMVSPVSDGFALTVNAVNDAPEFELSQSFANIGKNFANPIVVSASQMSPANESDQVVTYNIDPTSVSFADISFESTTGQLTITAITDGVGSQIFTITQPASGSS